jgi:lysine-ketoglutarate reductase/saccharopine dehydrogenase-like protein (TIGR00300 family)
VPGGPVSEVVVMDGHLVDSLLLPKVLDLVTDAGATYRILDLVVGTTRRDPSHARLEVTAADATALSAVLERIQVHGANPEETADAVLVVAERDGVLPEGFHATTNLPTEVRVAGRWLAVDRPEMDCALVVTGPSGAEVASVVPMHRVRAGDRVVVGRSGVRVRPPAPVVGSEGGEGAEVFGFMTSDVSSEKPKALSVARVAAAIRRARRDGRKVLVVCGPAVVHTGAAGDLADLVRRGWVQVLFAGNGFATHDIESAVLGTSLGVALHDGRPTEHGHANHLRVINEVRRHGSIAQAVASGWLSSGVLHACVQAGVPFVLGGSVRDDGPLPDVITDTVAAADAMRAQLDGVGVALMLASTLHAIATGNLLPAGVETFCVDINQAVATKLTDRGSHQALGIVTDVGLFVADLADRLRADGARGS